MDFIYLFLQWGTLVLVVVLFVWGVAAVGHAIDEDVEDYEDTDWWEYV